MAKILIACYSWSGNTLKLAKEIQKVTEGVLFEIEPETAYPRGYNDTVNQAKREIGEGFRPKLKKCQDISKYDVIFVGSPNWWSTIAPPVATFLSESNTAGKMVVPFFTHGGGGLARMAKDTDSLCPKAVITEAFCISGGGVINCSAGVSSWIKNIKIK